MSFSMVPGITLEQMLQVMGPGSAPAAVAEPTPEPVKASTAVVAPKRRKTEPAAGA